ncbi:MAG TPA: hypothetical protein VI861_00285 [Rickettsiales bacterium]|nr:hypothetical protein [Rickettsiales bacterium]
MKKIVAIFFILSITTSCAALIDRFSPNFPEANSFITRFPQNSKGIIIFQLSSKYPATIWCKTSLEIEVASANCFEMNPSQNYQIMMLEPGWYEIRAYEKNTKRYGKNILNSKFINLGKQRISKPELAFEVVEAKISFIGKISYRSSQIIQQNPRDEDFGTVKEALKNENIKELHKIFKGYKVEAEILAKKYEDKNYIKNLVKSQSNFIKIKKGGIKLK